MVQLAYTFDQNRPVFDQTPEWCDSFYDDIDLGIHPLNLEDMDCQMHEAAHLYDRELKVAPLEPQGHESERRLHSPIDGPTSWRYPDPPGTTYEPAQPPYFRDPHPPSAPDHAIPDLIHPSRSWRNGGTDADASSTVSGMSPPTPVAKAELHVDVVPAHPHPQAFPYPRRGPFDLHQPATPGQGHGGHLPMDEQQHAAALRGLQRTPGSGYIPLQPGPYHVENIQPKVQYQFSQGTLSPSVLARSPIEHEVPVGDIYDEQDAEGDDDSEYDPSGAQDLHAAPIRPRTNQALTRMAGPRPRQASKITAPHNPKHRVTKQNSTTQNPGLAPRRPSAADVLPSNTNCDQCNGKFSSTATLSKHVQTRHTRPFSCIFRRYGCGQTFGSKNEWTRHIRVQHLRLEVWRCDAGSCGHRPSPQDNGGGEPLSEDDGGESGLPAGHCFDRKDLYTQHLRRMHRDLLSTPPSPSSSSAASNRNNNNKGRGEATSSRSHNARESELQDTAHQVLRTPYTRPICPYCSPNNPSPSSSSSLLLANNALPTSTNPSSTSPVSEFTAWEPFLEHVARHLENSESEHDNDGLEDLGLKHWLIEQGLLVPTDVMGRPRRGGLTSSPTTAAGRGERDRGQWRIVGCDGKKNSHGHGSGALTGRQNHHSQQQQQQQGGTPRRGFTTQATVITPMVVEGTRRSARRGRKRKVLEYQEVDDGEGEEADAYGELE